MTLDISITAITSLGAVGNKNDIYLLENYDTNNKIGGEKMMIISYLNKSIFLLRNKKNNNFTNIQSKTIEILNKSKDRKRTYSEMVYLDKLY